MATILHEVIANFETSLASRLANGATSGTLSSITDKDGNTIPNGTYTMVFEPGTSNEEHLRFTLTSTAMSSIYSINRQGTATSGVQAASGHRAGSKVILTDWVNLLSIKDILNGQQALDGSNVLYYDSAPTFVSNNELITKKYADDLAIAGSPDASTTVKGIAEEATQAEINAGTAAGGTSARLFINPSTLATSNYGTFLPSTGQKDALVGTSGTPGSSNKYVTADDVAENTASKVVRRKSDSNVTVPTTPTASTDAASKAYADATVAKLTTVTSNTDTHSTTGEQTIATYSLAGGVLGTSNGVRLTIAVSDLDIANSHTVTLRFKYGATTIATTTLSEGGSTNLSNYGGKIEAVLLASGATGTQEGFMYSSFGTQGASAAASDEHPLIFTSTGTSSEDSTASKTVAVTAECSSSSAATGLVASAYFLERIA